MHFHACYIISEAKLDNLMCVHVHTYLLRGKRHISQIQSKNQILKILPKHVLFNIVIIKQNVVGQYLEQY